jgi:hypothetical protein
MGAPERTFLQISVRDPSLFSAPGHLDRPCAAGFRRHRPGFRSTVAAVSRDRFGAAGFDRAPDLDRRARRAVGDRCLERLDTDGWKTEAEEAAVPRRRLEAEPAIDPDRDRAATLDHRRRLSGPNPSGSGEAPRAATESGRTGHQACRPCRLGRQACANKRHTERSSAKQRNKRQRYREDRHRAGSQGPIEQITHETSTPGGDAHPGTC